MSRPSSHLAPRNDGYASAVKKPPPAAPQSNSSRLFYCTLCTEFTEHRTSQCPLGICAACKQQCGHWPGSPACELADVQCSHCHQMGHLQADCLYICFWETTRARRFAWETSRVALLREWALDHRMFGPHIYCLPPADLHQAYLFRRTGEARFRP